MLKNVITRSLSFKRILPNICEICKKELPQKKELPKQKELSQKKEYSDVDCVDKEEFINAWNLPRNSP